MIITNKYGIEMSSSLLESYFSKLIGETFKIIPIFEGLDYKTKKVIYKPEEAFKMFHEYLTNFLFEICGAYVLFNNSEYFVSLLANIEGMKTIKIDEHSQLKSLVMKCISILKKIIAEIKEGDNSA